MGQTISGNFIKTDGILLFETKLEISQEYNYSLNVSNGNLSCMIEAMNAAGSWETLAEMTSIGPSGAVSDSFIVPHVKMSFNPVKITFTREELGTKFEFELKPKS